MLLAFCKTETEGEGDFVFSVKEFNGEVQFVFNLILGGKIFTFSPLLTSLLIHDEKLKGSVV